MNKIVYYKCLTKIESKPKLILHLFLIDYYLYFEINLKNLNSFI